MTTPEAEKIGLGVTYVQGVAKIYMKTENPENLDLGKVRPIISALFTSLTERKFSECDITKVLLLKAFEE